MSIKYERQIVALKMKNKEGYSTFSVDDYLEVKNKEEDSPLELHAGFSRYVMTILDSQEGLGSAVKANIPYKDISIIKKKYDDVLVAKSIKDMLYVNQTSSDSSNTVNEPKIFSLQEFKGMTPSEVLLKDKANKQKLLDHIKILQDNITKYPKNKELIDAINNAINNIDNLSKSSENNSNSISIKREIYSPAIKYFRTEKNGLKECYEIKITYNDAMNYPFCIEISNFYSKVIKKPNGTTIIELSNKEELVSKKYRFSEDDFGYVMDRMENNLRLFEQSCYKDKRDIMEQNKFVPNQK